MILETLTFEKAAALATPIAKKIFKDNIFPVLKTTAAAYMKTKAAEAQFEKSMTKYLARVAGQCSTINTIAFQNAPKKLSDLYVPLTLEGEEKQIKITVKDNIDIFAHHNHILINDTAGMGKSTLSKKVVQNIISEAIFVPVFIELRQVEEKPIDEQILLSFGVDKNLGCDFLKKFPFVYIFDGLDEVPVDKKKKIVSLIKSFVEMVGTSRILITSRQETFLSEFYSFSRYKIKPLESKESFELLRKYDPSQIIADKLIASISRTGSGLREFLATPLYVSLLFCAYRHKTVIPRKKDLFYSQVYDALFESHDLSKEVGFVRPKFSKLDSADFHAVLRRLGFWCMVNNGAIEFQKDELEIIINDLLGKMSGVKTTAPDFVRDLVNTVPLFVKEGPSLRWSHKSLMEYFAAMFICNDAKSKQQDILLHYYNSDSVFSHLNVLELCADIDFSCFRASIVKQVLSEFKAHFESRSVDFAGRKVTKNALSMRVGLMFGTSYEFRLVDVGVDAEHFWGESPSFSLGYKSPIGFTHSEMIYHAGNDFGIQVSVLQSRARRILQIIRGKMPDIFYNQAPNYRDSAVRDSFERSSLKFNKFYVLNSAPRNKVNSLGNFEYVNKILNFCDHYVLHNAFALEELEKIEADRSNGIDGLLQGVLEAAR